MLKKSVISSSVGIIFNGELQTEESISLSMPFYIAPIK